MEPDPAFDTLKGRITEYAIMFACIGFVLFVLWLILPLAAEWVKPPPI